MPDRESALELDTKGSWVFSQLFRVLGTGDRLFVHRLENPLPAALAEADVFEGRLIRIDELPYADAIRGYFAKHVTATHYFATDATLKALAGRGQSAPLSIVDRGGDKVSLAADEALAVEVVKPDEVQIGLPKARFPTEDAARAAIDEPRRRGDRGAGPGAGAAAAQRGRVEPARQRAAAARALDVRGPLPGRAPAGRAGRAGRHRPHRRDPRRARDDRDARLRAVGRRRRAGRPRARRAPNAAWPPPTSPPCTRWRRS